MHIRLFGKKKEDDSYSAMPDPHKLKKEIEAASKLAEDAAKKAAEAQAKEDELQRQKELKEQLGCTEAELEAASKDCTNWWKIHYKELSFEEQVFLKLGRDGLMSDTAEIAKSTGRILPEGATDAMNQQQKLVAEAERRSKENKQRELMAALVDAGLAEVAAAPTDQTIQEQENEAESLGYRSLSL